MPNMTTKMATPNRQNLQEFALGGQDGQQPLSPPVSAAEPPMRHATGGRTDVAERGHSAGPTLAFDRHFLRTAVSGEKA